MEQFIGWLASAILLATLVKQTYTQWKRGSSEGVSKWLHIGSLVANGLFVIYSAKLGNWVFTVTNALLLINGLVGLAITRYHRRHSAEERRSRVRLVVNAGN